MARSNGRIVIRKQTYNDAQMTDMNSLSTALLQKPAEISRVMTYLGGREDHLGKKAFPLTTLTEGVGNSKGIPGIEYQYSIFERVKQARPLAVTPSVTSNVGRGGVRFVLTFPDKWFIKDYVLVSENQVQARIMSEPTPNGSNWDYELQLINPDPSATMPASEVQAGCLFAQLFAPVGTDFSRGNASNWSTPGKVKDKITTIRKSYQTSGKAQNQVIEIALPKQGGGSSKYWMDFQEWQLFLQWKEEMESLYMYGQRSYGVDGETRLRDENGQPIVIGPGILQQIQNNDTYSELTINKLENVIGDMLFGMSDGANKEITLLTGTGGRREFDRAIKDKLKSLGYAQDLGSKFVTGEGRTLSMTGFFTSYEHVDGHRIKIVHTPAFDVGGYAQARRKHPVTGFPLESYRMVFLDTSSYEGEPNVQMLHEEGREMIRWAVAGSTIPRGFTGNALRASDIDGCSVHYMKSGGIVLKRFDTSINFECVAA
jgi:hypothetical protein